MNIIDFLQKLQDHFIRISHNIDRIDKYLVAFFLHLLDISQPLINIIVMESHADRIDCPAIIRLELIDTVFIVKRHGCKHRLAPVFR